MDELKNIVEEMVEEDRINFEAKEDEDGQIDSSKNNIGENGGSGDNSDVKSSMALFDKLQEKEDNLLLPLPSHKLLLELLPTSREKNS